MPITILPREETIASQIGTGLGAGLGSGLQALAQMQLQDLQKRKQAQQIRSSLQNIPGITDEAAQFLSNISPEERKSALQNLGPLMQLFQSQGIQQPSAQIGTVQPSEERITEKIKKPGIQEKVSIEDVFKSPADKRFEKEFEQRERLATEKKEERERERREKKASPFIKGLEEDTDMATKIKDLISEGLNILETGKSASGISGEFARRAPSSFSSDETRRLMSVYNKLVLLEADSMKGRPTDYKIRLAQSLKPEISEKRSTQISKLKDMLKRAEKVLLQEKAYNDVLEEHKGEIPDNLKKLVKKRAHELGKQSEKDKVSLPPIEEFSDDTIIEISGKKFQKTLDKWTEI